MERGESHLDCRDQSCQTILIEQNFYDWSQRESATLFLSLQLIAESLLLTLTICAAENPSLVVSSLSQDLFSILSLRTDILAFPLLFFIHTLVSVSARPPPSIATDHNHKEQLRMAQKQSNMIANFLTVEAREKIGLFLLSLCNSELFSPFISIYASHVALYYFIRFSPRERAQLAKTFLTGLDSVDDDVTFPLACTMKDFILKFSVSDPDFMRVVEKDNKLFHS
ncbi:hypothetical protein RCL1_002900 [Eukaryota sp. TZLM3-RCL]